MPGSHQGLLIGECNVLPCLDRRDRRTDADHTHHCGQHNVHVPVGGDLKQTFHATDHLHLQIRDQSLQLICRFLRPHAGDLRHKFPDLLLHFFYTAVRRQSHHRELAGICPDDLQCLCAYRTSRTQNSYPFHTMLPLIAHINTAGILPENTPWVLSPS